MQEYKPTHLLEGYGEEIIYCRSFESVIYANDLRVSVGRIEERTGMELYLHSKHHYPLQAILNFK
jgi:hypothetical protein